MLLYIAPLYIIFGVKDDHSQNEGDLRIQNNDS